MPACLQARAVPASCPCSRFGPNPRPPRAGPPPRRHTASRCQRSSQSSPIRIRIPRFVASTLLSHDRHMQAPCVCAHTRRALAAEHPTDRMLPRTCLCQQAMRKRALRMKKQVMNDALCFTESSSCVSSVNKIRIISEKKTSKTCNISNQGIQKRVMIKGARSES
jgi:hypothetical protein